VLALLHVVSPFTVKSSIKSCTACAKLHLHVLASSTDKTHDFHGNALKKIVVFGATGRTGRLVVEELCSRADAVVTCPVRDTVKAKSIFSEISNGSYINFLSCDFSKVSQQELFNVVKGVDVVISCLSYRPAFGELPDPFGPLKIDNLGTKRIVDACVDAKVHKFVLISSLLTNGLMSGQLLNPQFLLLNSFGGVLFHKHQAELYLQKQLNIDYTIIRPGGLRSESVTYPILYGAADTFPRGSISRQQVADVVVSASYSPLASNKVVEIIASKKAKLIPAEQGFEIIDSFAKKISSY